MQTRQVLLLLLMMMMPQKDVDAIVQSADTPWNALAQNPAS